MGEAAALAALVVLREEAAGVDEALAIDRCWVSFDSSSIILCFEAVSSASFASRVAWYISSSLGVASEPAHVEPMCEMKLMRLLLLLRNEAVKTTRMALTQCDTPPSPPRVRKNCQMWQLVSKIRSTREEMFAVQYNVVGDVRGGASAADSAADSAANQAEAHRIAQRIPEPLRYRRGTAACAPSP